MKGQIPPLCPADELADLFIPDRESRRTAGHEGWQITLINIVRARDEQIRAALLEEPPLWELPEFGDLTEEQDRENDAGRRALERFATRLGGA